MKRPTEDNKDLEAQELQGTDLRDQCQSLWQVRPKAGYDHRYPQVQQKGRTHKPRISQYQH